ncbi:MAG: archaemetzincin family Zn-dependent metalloprotease [Aquificae bacterium]|nr:archaemetzincin family Zn-dependent metalloprotease [Aquificota bacterium]
MGFIYLVAFGGVEERVLLADAVNVKEIFELEVRVAHAGEPPPEAYDPKRGQYRASVLLEALSRVSFPDMVRLVGLVDVDLYEEGLNFVFGEAQYGGKYAVVSTYRLKDADERRYFERVFKETNHELGHTFGLKHCPDPYCVMSFSNSLAEVDRKSRDFCPNCRRKLDYVLSYYR